MSKYKYLFKNFGLLTISSLSTKVLVFFLVPLYTSVLSTEEYGIYDNYLTTINLLLPILVCDIWQAVFRFSIDKDSDKQLYFSIGIRYGILACFVLFIFEIINYTFNILPLFNIHPYLFLIMFMVRVFSNICLEFARALEKIKEISIAGVISSLFTILCNILFLLVLKIGLEGFFLVNIIVPFVQLFFLAFSIQLRHYCTFRRNKEQSITMVRYSSPMIITDVAWWINGALDRYIITSFCGLQETGVYSLGHKIPTILDLFSSLFGQAWNLSAIKEFDTETSLSFFERTYKYYNIFLVSVCSFLIVTSKIIASFLYAKDFFIAWKYVPFLLMATLFGGLSGFLGSFFSAAKNTKIFAISTCIGAIINIILNVLFIRRFGALGAAFATTISYFVIWFIRLFCVKKLINLKLQIFQDLIAYMLLFIQIYVIETKIAHLFVIELSLSIILFVVYFKEIYILFQKLLKVGIK